MQASPNLPPGFQDTPPPEEPFTPVSFPSMSTPSYPVHHPVDRRPRRHTITRPDSALGHLPEVCTGEEDDTGAFDRISGILSSLLKEANEAVNGVSGKEQPIATAYNDNNNDENGDHNEMQPLWSISRPGMMPPATCPPRSSNSTSHTRNSSISSMLSLSSADSSTVITPPLTPKPSVSLPRKRKTARPLSCPTMRRPQASMNVVPANRRSVHQQATVATTLLEDPLVESYKRLDLSLAVVDSLSRDLVAQPDEQDTFESSSKYSSSAAITDTIPASSSAAAVIYTSNAVKMDLRLIALLILPFLHIPHVLISMIYDTLSTNDPHNLTGMISWGIFYCLANLVMDHAVVAQYTKTQKQHHRRLSPVPGSYTPIDLVPPPINTQQPTVLYPRRSNHRVVVPRRSSLYRKLQQQQQPLRSPHHQLLFSHQDTLRQLALKASSSSVPITRSSTQPGCSMPTTHTYVTSSPTPPNFVRRNSF